MTHAAKKLPILSAMKIPRNVRNAMKDLIQLVTQLLSAPPLVESHTESATQELESAPHVNQEKTKTAPKSRPLATRNVSSNPCQPVVLMENANHAIQLTQDVSQPPLVSKLANHTHHPQPTTTSAHGTQLSHNVLLIRKDQ
jgi:hypothetical protein